VRVLVCGGRDYNDRETVGRVLSNLNPSLVIEGGATGADRLARLWAARTTTDVDTYEADWRTHGKAAGPIRNQRMLDEGKPDLVVAFPGGRGTADMIRRAEAAGMPVQRVPS